MRFKPLAIQGVAADSSVCRAVLAEAPCGPGRQLYQGQQRLEKIPQTVNSLYMLPRAKRLGRGNGHDPARAREHQAPDRRRRRRTGQRLGQHLRYDKPEQAREHHNIYRLDVHLSRAGQESLGTLTLYVSNTLRREVLNDLISSMTQRVLDFAALALLIIFILRRRFVLPVQQLRMRCAPTCWINCWIYITR